LTELYEQGLRDAFDLLEKLRGFTQERTSP